MRKITPEEIPRRVAAVLEGRASHKKSGWGKAFAVADIPADGVLHMAWDAGAYRYNSRIPRTPIIIVYEDGLVIAERYPAVLAVPGLQ